MVRVKTVDAIKDVIGEGDDFLRKGFIKGIHRKTDMLFVMNLLLLGLIVFDEIKDIMISGAFFWDVLSLSVIGVAIVLLYGSYVIIRDLREWEDTYRKVRKLVG